MTTDKDKVIALLNSKKVAHHLEAGGDIVINDGFGKVLFTSEGKLAGITRTVKASLAKHINKAVY